MPTLLRLLVLPIALVLAVAATRAMVFQAPADHPLRVLRPKFAGHPAALVDRAMREIGTAAAKGASMPESAQRLILDAARKDPLTPAPFLVNGTIAQMAGDDRRAERLFLAARLRDPRGAAARYFLADRYLKTNRIGQGLVEMAALSRISAQASQPMAPALAAYARTPGAVPQLRRFFAGASGLRDTTLEILASDAANVDLVLALAPPLPIHRSPPPAWPRNLVSALVTAGNYAAADTLWQKINGIRDRGLLYDPQFRDRSAAPPFSWQLTSGSGGVAEASGGGGLDIIYYGREDITLATQLVRLSPGIYRIAMRVEAPVSAVGLEWSVACGTGDLRPFFQLPLDSAKQGIVSGSFAIPSGNCPVQSIALRGKPRDSAETAQVTISSLSLQPLSAAR